MLKLFFAHVQMILKNNFLPFRTFLIIQVSQNKRYHEKFIYTLAYCWNYSL